MPHQVKAVIKVNGLKVLDLNLKRKYYRDEVLIRASSKYYLIQTFNKPLYNNNIIQLVEQL